MAEPTTPATVAVFAAGASSVTIALIGVDTISLVWGMVGSLFALLYAEQMTRGRAIVYVILSTLIGAALGTLAQSFAGDTNRPLLIVGSLVGGSASQRLLNALVALIERRISAAGSAGKQGGAS